MDINPIDSIFNFGSKLIERIWPDPVQAEAAKTKLMELQINGQLQQMVNDTEIFKAQLADTADARKRETVIATSDAAPLINKIITPLLALIVTIGGGYIIYASPNNDVRMAAVSIVTLVLGYYFGTSIGSNQNRSIIENLTKK